MQNIIALTFKRDFEAFAVRYGLPITDLEELIRYNQEDADRRVKYGQDQLEAAAAVQTPDEGPLRASIQTAQEKLDALLSGGLDAVVFLNTSASAVVSATGYPKLTVPMGTDAAGIPQGATFAAEHG